MAQGGGARRAQKELVRKQRAKRNKLNGSDDDDDSNTRPYHYWNDSASTNKPTAASKTAPEAMGDQKINPSTGSSADQTNITNSDNQESKPSSSTNDSEPISGKAAPVKSATTISKKPLDKIERMRLKKQQQKARDFIDTQG